MSGLGGPMPGLQCLRLRRSYAYAFSHSVRLCQLNHSDTSNVRRSVRSCIHRVSQNYPNIYFSTIISTAVKPLKMWIPKFSEILIKRQS